MHRHFAVFVPALNTQRKNCLVKIKSAQSHWEGCIILSFTTSLYPHLFIVAHREMACNPDIVHPRCIKRPPHQGHASAGRVVVTSEHIPKLPLLSSTQSSQSSEESSLWLLLLLLSELFDFSTRYGGEEANQKPTKGLFIMYQKVCLWLNDVWNVICLDTIL